MNEWQKAVNIELTTEQLKQLKPIFDHVNRQPKDGGQIAIIGQAFSATGLAEFRFLNHLQTVVVRSAISAALETERRTELDVKRKQINTDIERLEAEKNRIDKQIADIETREQGQRVCPECGHGEIWLRGGKYCQFAEGTCNHRCTFPVASGEPLLLVECVALIEEARKAGWNLNFYSTPRAIITQITYSDADQSPDVDRSFSLLTDALRFAATEFKSVKESL